MTYKSCLAAHQFVPDGHKRLTADLPNVHKFVAPAATADRTRPESFELERFQQDAWNQFGASLSAAPQAEPFIGRTPRKVSDT